MAGRIPDLGLVIAAGGSARRFGANKLLAPFRGEPLILASLRTLGPCAAQVVMAVPEDGIAFYRDLVKNALDFPVCITPGGDSREQSVCNALRQLDASVIRYAAIHDGARPLASRELLYRVLEAARIASGAIPGRPVADTVKRTDETGKILATVSRENLYAVSTPQVFCLQELLEAWRLVPDYASCTDDAAIMEKAGREVRIVPDDPWNFKVTRPEDLASLEKLQP